MNQISRTEVMRLAAQMTAGELANPNPTNGFYNPSEFDKARMMENNCNAVMQFCQFSGIQIYDD